MKISVVIPTHNRSDALQKTVQHLAAQQIDEQWEVIVVNNNSTDDTDEVVANLQKTFPVALRLIHEKTPGPAAARNAGGRAAKGEYLIFIDNDIITEPDFVRRHLNKLNQNPGCWIVNQVVNLPEQEETTFGRFRNQLYPILPSNSEMSEAAGIAGQGSSMSSEQFRQLGGYDENFFVASGEDREFSIRARLAGIKILTDPSIITKQDDWAGSSIRDYCRRQRIYKQTEPFFWQKYGDKYHNLRLVHENLPPDLKKDGLKLFVWKYTKDLLGSDVGQFSIIVLCEFFEKTLPAPLILWKLYRLALAGAVYRGFQEGLAIQEKNKSPKGTILPQS